MPISVGAPRLLLRRLREVMAERESAQARLDKVVVLIASNMVAEVCSLYLRRRDSSLELFATEGLNPEAVHNTHLKAGEGLVGLIAQHGEPMQFADAQTHPAFSYRPETGEEIYHSFLGVPITVKGQAVGDLYLTNKRGVAEFGMDDQRLVERFAAHAGLAIENARLSERVQALAVVEERERIGRDLHDGVIQRMYGVALGLDDVAELASRDPVAAGERIDRAIDALHETIAEVRTFIYGLRPGLDTAGSLGSALESLAEETRLRLGRRARRVENLQSHLAVELAVAGQVDRAHAAAAEAFDGLVARAGEVGPVGDLAQVLQRGVGDPLHSASAVSFPSSARASARNSSSLPVASRSPSSSNARKRRRAHASQLVTCENDAPPSVVFAMCSAPPK